MSGEYRTFEEWLAERVGLRPYRGPFHKEQDEDMKAAWLAGCADLSAILGEFEALAGKWKKVERAILLRPRQETFSECLAELSALIQSVKERM